MANISLGNTLTTGLVLTGDVTGNLVFTSTGGYIDASSVTGAIVVPVGNTAQRPATVANGALRYSTTTSSFEGYAAGAWGAIGGSSGGGTTWANVQTANLTAVSGNAYPINTTTAAIYATLPASPSAGNTVLFVDYAGTFGINNFTILRNGSNISGTTSNVTVTTNGASVSLVYIDATKGWIPYNGFSVSPIGTYSVQSVIVAGGGGGGGAIFMTTQGGGGGAGGLVYTSSTTVTPGASYTITVGGGGAGGVGVTYGSNGTNSSGLTITAIGGGVGGAYGGSSGVSGGSGGGGGTPSGSGGSATSGQGYAGGTGTAYASNASAAGGGGGGAAGIGSPGSGGTGGTGGTGSAYTISGASVYYAGGGGGGGYNSAGPGGSGGGGSGAVGGGGANGSSGSTNTGGGGGGAVGNNSAPGNNNGGGGGSGIVILSYLGPQRGTGGTVSSSGGSTIHTFTSSGTYTA